MKKNIIFVFFVAFSLLKASPFDVSATIQKAEKNNLQLTLSLTVPDNAYLYEEQLQLNLPDGVKAEKVAGMEATFYSDDEGYVYKKSGEVIYQLSNAGLPLDLTVHFQGCVDGMCYLPEQKKFHFNEIGGGERRIAELDIGTVKEETDQKALAWKLNAKKLRLLGKASGFLSVADFSELLVKGKADEIESESENLLARVFSKYGLFFAALLIIPLGLLLNLTPCILPMIPINLSIIGAAGSDSSGKSRGLMLGSLYGFAMALVYGFLGVAVVLTGSRFGAINSSAIFNLIIAIVFVFLALSMFDVFSVDFSRFRSGQRKETNNPWLAALILGALSAILAGACVAPVLIWVLLLATDLYAKGKTVAILLPLLLGVGMALPWPILGAGVSRMPKPGAWMERVKQAFGVLILLFAVYYLHIAWSLSPFQGEKSDIAMLQGWNSNLLVSIEQAKVEDKPILLYFWGVSCKSCTKMKKTTLQDPKVKGLLKDYIPVAFQADDSRDPLVAAVLKEYQVIGMPTYVLLKYQKD